MSYEDVARLACSPGAATSAGNALGVPNEVEGWHRVVNAKGRLTSPSVECQRRLLQDEEVVVTKSKVHYYVDLTKHRWVV